MEVKGLCKEEIETESIVDRLSQLPESLQLHILSSLDARHVVAMSLLSKSWASIWTCIPVLNFSSLGLKDDIEFDNFVVNALSRRQPGKLDRLTYKRTGSCRPGSLKEVFDYACLHSVEELEAIITPTLGCYKGHNWPIRSSDSLTSLKLQGKYYVGCSFLGPKGSVGSFRNLSSLHLEFGIITDIDPFSGFPALQKLSLIRCQVKTNDKTLNVHAPLLSEFTSYNTEVYRYEFTTPKLRYFEWVDYNDIPWCSKAHFPVLDTTIINYTGRYTKDKTHYDYLLMMFNILQGAKSLTISAHTLRLLSLFLMNECSPFRDLKCLNLDLRTRNNTPFFIEKSKLVSIVKDYFLDKSLDAKCIVINYPNAKSSGQSTITSLAANDESMPSVSAVQTLQSGYVKLWEGELSGRHKGESVVLTRLRSYRKWNTSAELSKHWPVKMQFNHLMSRDSLNKENYVGKPYDRLGFVALDHHPFFDKMQEKNVCAVIGLQSHTLVLLVSDIASTWVGMLFPKDEVPKLPIPPWEQPPSKPQSKAMKDG